MNFLYDTFPTPLGDFSIAVDQSGSVIGAAFGDVAALQSRLETCHLLSDKPAVSEAREQIRAYYAGELRDFGLPLAPRGTVFQQRVWTALRAIPYGETRSYGDLARELGTSPRAVGNANATNPICLIVPCHRVIGTNGSLTGYAFGENIKQRLLEHEGVQLFAAKQAVA
jgi:methylated-DNA-[protein]-cysteine S-methyltransferase